jgi:hypothetical protein
VGVRNFRVAELQPSQCQKLAGSFSDPGLCIERFVSGLCGEDVYIIVLLSADDSEVRVIGSRRICFFKILQPVVHDLASIYPIHHIAFVLIITQRNNVLPFSGLYLQYALIFKN